MESIDQDRSTTTLTLCPLPRELIDGLVAAIEELREDPAFEWILKA